MKKLKEFFGQRSYYLTFAAMILAIVSSMQFNNQTKETSELSSNKPVVKIGVSLPLSGDISYMGEALKGALGVAMEDIEKKNLKNSYELIVENNGFDAKQIMSINTKFLKTDKVNAIVDFTSLVGNLTTLITQNNEAIHFNVCASDKNIADGKNNFLHTTLPDYEAQELVKHIKGKYSNLAVVYLNEVSADLSAEEIFKELENNQISYQKYAVNPKETDMRFLIDKIEAQKPDLYVVLLYSPSIEIFVKQLKEKSIDTALTSTHYFSNTNNPALLEGAEYVDYPQVSGEMRERIIKRNQGRSEYMMCTGNIYDVVMMLVNVFEKSSNQKEALYHLQNLKEYTGVMGSVSQDNKGVFQVSPVLRILKNGQPIELVE